MKAYRLFMGLLVGAVLLSGCGNASGGSGCVSGQSAYEGVSENSLPENFNGNNYYEVAALEIQPYGDKESQGIVYYAQNPEEYSKSVTCSVSCGNVEISDSGSNEIITVPMTLIMQGEYTEDCVDYSCAITPSIEIADKYSGLVMPVRVLEGEDGYSYNGTMQHSGENISIVYSCVISSQVSEWTQTSDGRYVCDIIFEAIFTITVPGGYDGFVFKITPATEFFSDESVGSSGEISSNERIIDDYPEGTVLMEIK